MAHMATARLFVAEGAEVAITGRDQKTLDEAVAELGPNARGYRADVTVADDQKRLFADLAKDFGKLDIVFANAGIGGRTPTGATDEAAFENIVHTNLNGAFFTVNSAAPLLTHLFRRALRKEVRPFTVTALWCGHARQNSRCAPIRKPSR
jgi:NAD(P)-dependent dehydrogenase (short-subunit alcohol dehydrogenase family)